MANASPSAASLSTDLYGQATLNACEEIRKRLEPVARALQESKGAAPSFKEVAFAAYFQVLRFGYKVEIITITAGISSPTFHGIFTVPPPLTRLFSLSCLLLLLQTKYNKYHISASTCRPTVSTSSRPTAAATTGMCPYLRARPTASEALLSTTLRRCEYLIACVLLIFLCSICFSFDAKFAFSDA